MHRRQFLSQVSLSAGLLLTSSVGGSMVASQASRKLVVALVGLGNYSTHQRAPALQQTELCRLAGIVTGTPAKAEAWAKQYDIPEKSIYNYGNFEQIKYNIDIVIV